MILFIFEGKKTEPNIFKTIEKLYFSNSNEQKVCCFGYNIYELYKIMNESDFTEDIVSVVRKKMLSRNDHSIPDDVDISDFSEVFLFFDYDFQNKNLTSEELNNEVAQMLIFFSNETENGKLYIDYPMVESIKCTGLLPDSDFVSYKVSRRECMDFKNYACQTYTAYKSTDFFLLPVDGKTHELRNVSDAKFEAIKQNWNYLNHQNIAKANYVCTGENIIPDNKSDVSQMSVFANQLEKYVLKTDEVAILNSFPLFLFEYFKLIF